MEKEKGVLRGEIMKSFTHSGEMALMTDVIEVTSPMGEPSKVALAGSNTWAPGIADRMGLYSYCRVVTDRFRLLTVQVQAQFQPHTLYFHQVMPNVLQCTSHRAVIPSLKSDLYWEQMSCMD